MNDDATTQRDTVERLADSFMASYRTGACPSVDEYALQFPELADQLRELLTALVILEQNAPHREAAAPPFPGPTWTVAPREIGDFLIVREIARGGMGVVYEAVQQSLGRHVALKVLSTSGLLSPSHLERFRLEARAAARLHHTHIVPVFGVGEHHGLHYYAMQFIQGHSLDLVINELRLLRRTQQGDKTVMAAADPFTRLVADGLLTGQFRVVADEVVDTAGNGDKFSAEAGPFETQPQEPTLPVMHSQTEFTSSPGGREFYRSVARVGLQVAEALAYAHGEGILHRDIKPSNLLLDAKGNVWVTDFGLAKAEGCDGLTQSGDFVGTLRYMPPERLDGRSDRRGDIYSLGATLYELLSLRPFLHAASRGQLVDKIQREDPPALSKSDRSIPADLETIVLKALAKEPTLRYCSAEELAEDLRRFLADRSILARRSTPVEQLVRWCRRNPRWAAMFAMVAGLLLVIAVGSSALSARALRAERQTLAELFQAKVNEARATTLSGRPGQRFRTLAIVNEARRIAAKLELPADRLADLRNVAIVAFTLPDLYPRREWEGFPRKSFAVDFDDNLQIYARTDVDGSCTVRQVEGDVELHHVAGDGTGVGLYWPLLSRDGRSLVVSERGKRAKLWEIQGDQPHLVLTLNDVWTTEYHPHGRQVAFAHTDGTITTHDVNTGQVIHRLAPSGLTRELAIALHPTVPLVAVGSYFGRMVQVRDLRTGQVIKSMEVSRTEGGHVAWHPSGEWLAATDGAEGRIHVFDRATFQRQFTIGPVDGGARIFFDHSGNQLAVVGWDQRIQLFDFQTGKLRFEILDANPTNCPRFSGDDLRLAGFTRGTTMGVWQIGAGLEYHWFARRKLPRQTGYESCATSPDGRMLAVAMTDGVDFWDLEVGERLATLPLDGPRFVHFEPPKAMAGPHAPACPTKPLFPCPLDRGAVLIGETSGTYRWPIRQDPDDAGLMTIGPPEALRLPPGNFRQSRDGKVRIMGFSNAGSFQPWAGIWIQHADRPASIQQLLAGASLYMGTISPDGRWLVTSDLYTERTRLWDAGTGEFTRQLPCRGRYLEFSPDGRWLAASGPRGGLVDARTWQEVRQLPEVARFSPDSKIMVVQGYTSLIRLVDVVSGDELCRLEDPNAAPARDIAFTPDSGKLVTIGYSEGIRVWDLPRLRQRLAAQGLDWDSVGNERVERPARLRGLRLAAKQSRPTQPRPLAIQIEMGDFAQLRPRQMSDNLDLAIDAAPQIPQRWIARAEFHQAAGRHEHALADLRQALTCAQGLNDSRLQAKVCNELARLLCLAPERFRDAQQALTLAEQAVELRPGEWTYTNTLGIAYYRLGRFPEAVVTLERSLADDNGHANAADLCFLAMCHLQLNDQPRARECLEQAQGWHDRNANDLPSEDRRELQCILDEAEKLFASYEG